MALSKCILRYRCPHAHLPVRLLRRAERIVQIVRSARLLTIQHTSLKRPTRNRCTGLCTEAGTPSTGLNDFARNMVTVRQFAAGAWTVMKRMGTHHLTATSVHGTLVGMTSNHDLLPHAHELESINSSGPFATHKLAREMSCRVLSATSTTEICEITHVILDEQEGAIPILDNSRQLVSILTTSDILRAIVHRSPLELWT